MLSDSLKQEFLNSLELAFVRGEAGASLDAIAERWFDAAEPGLIEKLTRPILIGRARWELGRIHRIAGGTPVQMILPGMPKPPAQITLLNRKRRPLLQCDRKQLAQYRRVLCDKRPPYLPTVDALLAWLKPFDDETPGITVEQAFEQMNQKKARAAGA